MSQHILEYDIEVGERALYCTIIIEYDYEPGEPMVRYYPDGSGYPGSPAGCAPWHVQVTTAEVAGETLDRDALAKIGNGSWLRWLDAQVYYLIESDCEEYGPFWEAMMSNATGEEY
jgi:hypothetical protein